MLLKVGDIVSRAYLWPELISGIIIEEKRDRVDLAKELKPGRKPSQWENVTFVVAWSDGSVTEETDIELEYFEDMLKHESKINWDEFE